MDDITVDLGEIPLEHAKTLLLCVNAQVCGGYFWGGGNYERAESLKALLTYRIAKAEKDAAPSVPPVLYDPANFPTRSTSDG